MARLLAAFVLTSLLLVNALSQEFGDIPISASSTTNEEAPSSSSSSIASVVADYDQKPATGAVVPKKPQKPVAKAFRATFKGTVHTFGNVGSVTVMIDGFTLNSMTRINVGAKMKGITNSMGFVGRYETTFKGQFLNMSRTVKLTGTTLTEFKGLYNGMPLETSSEADLSMSERRGYMTLTNIGKYRSHKGGEGPEVIGSYQFRSKGNGFTWETHGKLEGKKYQFKLTGSMEQAASWVEGLSGSYMGEYDGKPWKGKWPLTTDGKVVQ